MSEKADRKAHELEHEGGYLQARIRSDLFVEKEADVLPRPPDLSDCGTLFWGHQTGTGKRLAPIASLPGRTKPRWC